MLPIGYRSRSVRQNLDFALDPIENRLAEMSSWLHRTLNISQKKPRPESIRSNRTNPGIIPKKTKNSWNPVSNPLVRGSSGVQLWQTVVLDIENNTLSVSLTSTSIRLRVNMRVSNITECVTTPAGGRR